MKRLLFLSFLGLLMLSFVKKEKLYKATQQNPKLLESIKRGKTIYKDMCLYCHMADGRGTKNTIPPLAKADFLMQQRAASIRVIKYGISGKIVVNGITYNTSMANLGLYNDEVADVMNYITNTWGNKNDVMVTEAEVKAISKSKKQ